MIKSLKQDSLKFESENRRRANAEHRPQTYIPSGNDPSSRMEAYEDHIAFSIPVRQADTAAQYEMYRFYLDGK